MSHDLVLVTAAELGEADVVHAIESVRSEVGPLRVQGSFEPHAADGPGVGALLVSGSDGSEFLSVFTPAQAGGARLADVSTRVGIEAPVDSRGRAWLTDMAMPTAATDEQIIATLTALAHLARDHGGYLLVNGEYVELDGVPDPPRAELPDDKDTKELERPQHTVFAAARLDLGDASGKQGWDRLIRCVGTFLNDPDGIVKRNLTPTRQCTDVEEDWHPLEPALKPAQWSVATQHLGRESPHARWSLDGASGPAQIFSGFQVGCSATPADGERLLPQLERLAQHGLRFGLVHLWTRWEPRGGGFSIPTREAPDPELDLYDLDLAEALPNLYWAQVFGPPWVELFGVDRLASTPAYRVEEVADDCWVVQITENLADVRTDHDGFVALRKRCKEHLGADCFRDPDDRRPRRAPHLPTLAERGLVPPTPSIEEFLGTHGG